MGTDRSDPIGGALPAALEKPKTISGPYQTYQILVSVSTLAELQTMQPPGVNGAPTFFRDNGLPWFWFSQLPAGFTASADGHTGATAGKSGFYVSLFALVAAVSLGAFLTVARASSSRMLDVPASTLHLVKDGARTYVQSVVSGWHWESNFPAAKATDNNKTCRPTAWIATGLNGAFVRDLQGNDTARTQGAWFVNPAAPDNEGSGSALDPVQSDDEVVRRWGEGSIPLTVPVTVTYATSPTSQTNFDVQYIGGSLTLLGTKSTLLGPIVVTNVTVQNRGAQTRWDIQAPGLGATHVGSIVQIIASATPASINAYAVIEKDLGGGRVVVSPFGQAVVSTTSFNVITPQVGDTIEVITFPTLHIGTLRWRNGSDAPFAASPLTNCTVVDLLTLQGSTDNANLTGIIFADSTRTFYQRVLQSRMRWAGSGGTNHFFCGGGFISGTNSFHSGVTSNLDACAILPNVSMVALPGSSIVLRKDCYFQQAGWLVVGLCRINSQGVNYSDSSANGCTLAFSMYQQSGAVGDWGTNNASFGINAVSGAMYQYATKPTINSGLGVGRETKVGGTDKLYGAIPFVEPTNLAAIVLTAF